MFVSSLKKTNKLNQGHKSNIAGWQCLKNIYSINVTIRQTFRLLIQSFSVPNIIEVTNSRKTVIIKLKDKRQ